MNENAAKSGNERAAEPVLDKLRELYYGLLDHDGFGELRIEMRILKFGQKEVILHCGKQYRFVVDFPAKQ